MKAARETWHHALLRRAERVLGKKQGRVLCAKYRSLATENYQALVAPRFALKDMLHLERLQMAECPSAGLLSPCREVEHYRLHFYSREERFLDEYIPVLENLHLRAMDQVQFTVEADGSHYFIKSFTIKPAQDPCASMARLRPRLLEAIRAILEVRVENDALNKLIILTGMGWQEIDVLRAYRNYYLQLGHRTTRASIHHALLCNPGVALCLYHYFDARFRPYQDGEDAALREEEVLLPMHLELLQSLEKVADLNDDRILRNLFNLIDATMRCNFYLRRHSLDYLIAFKIDSLGVIEMPPPKPQYEIFVHAATMQGIHLRAGKVSRGGIRWSDRPDDFRSEILGLMQTQINKNALIVPTGAKGGFVLTSNGLRSDLKEAGKQAYLMLIKGLLDLTDNYDDAQAVSHPPNLVVYDDPDPYLVVAADKGTAQFSDIANAVSNDYRFWLGDAFASGGSHGYNHKSLGITARGAWECVKRHFRELGKNIQSEAFTVVGVGSMDGDVFGNGMLLSPCIRLRAAFSGQHIFLDPNPPEDDAPLLERKRLFELPGSTWNDYDRALLSNGGGVFPRASKDIPLSPEIKKWLGVHYRALDGESLIRFLLTAETDLLWLGGIGTYVKASTEKHEDVSDRANDNVRIDASVLRAKVVGEGANLGFTQKARIEYGLKGGRINTDAIDNSAGVDTSDHEVNLKIFLTLLSRKKLLVGSQTLFAEMTEQVCGLVLADNYAQSQCLSLEQCRAAASPAPFFQVAERLQAAGFLEDAKEGFPSEKDLQNRPAKTITRPEFAVLMSAAKMLLTEQIQEHKALLEDPCCDCYLRDYFPDPIVRNHRDALALHPLADKIKATFISNKIINQAGCRILSVPVDGDKNDLLERVSCYLGFERILEADALRRRIESLDNQIPAELQYQCLLNIENVLDRFCQWALSHQIRIRPDAATMEYYQRYLQDAWRYFSEQTFVHDESVKAWVALYEEQGVASELALRLTFIAGLNDFLWFVDLASKTQKDFAFVAQRYREISAHLGIDAVFERLSLLPSLDVWQDRVNVNLREKLMALTGTLLIENVASAAPSCAAYFEMFKEHGDMIRYLDLVREINHFTPTNLYPYIVLCGQMEQLLVSLSGPSNGVPKRKF